MPEAEITPVQDTVFVKYPLSDEMFIYSLARRQVVEDHERGKLTTNERFAHLDMMVVRLYTIGKPVQHKTALERLSG